MEGYSTDEDQLAEIKKWWDNNGKSILLGVVVGLAVLAGWRYWVDYKNDRNEQASALFEAMMTGLEQEENNVVLERGGSVVSQYSDTPYAALATLALAKVKFAQGDFPAAQTYLQWALDNTNDNGVKHVARLRLARVLWSQDQAEQALTLLSSVDPDVFAASYEELRGDISVSLGKNDDARNAYVIALASPSYSGDRSVLKMKIDDLGLLDGQ